MVFGNCIMHISAIFSLRQIYTGRVQRKPWAGLLPELFGLDDVRGNLGGKFSSSKCLRPAVVQGECKK